MTPITRPLRRAEVWQRWRELAAAEGLHEGDPIDLDAAGFDAGSPTWRLYEPAVVERVLDAMLAQKRRQRPMLTVQVDEDQILIRVERGLHNNWTRASAEVGRAIVEIHRRQVVEDSYSSGLPVERTAVRWGRKRGTIQHWRRCTKRAANPEQEARKTGLKLAS